MRSITYNYGFVDNGPYEILSGGNYGGIIAQYLKEFNDFSDTELKFTKYKNVNKFEKAVLNNKINLYFAYYNIENSLTSINSGIGISYSVLVSKKDSLVVNSLESLKNDKVYVLKDSNLYNYLVNNTNLDIATYKDIKELKKLVKKDKIVIVDTNVATVYKNEIFGDYSTRYSGVANSNYVFKISANETYNKLFTRYVNIKDSKDIINKGIYNYDMTLRSGTITATIAKYFMYILIIFVLVFLYVYRLAKRVKISKKIKKEDKLKYIDQLTSLKNRNYLSENLENWGKNTIYPQAVIVIDLNNLQNINDTMGYEQGDIQIKGAANILVKTQLDNTEIIRTNGNEFVIYLVGYQIKQITSYIHKLNKEFKKLPYEYGAAIGYSMIEDKLKSIEDAINEAVEDVKKQKENKKEA
jgi:diguanylate cyclase (GGDEF)-like protein